MKIYEIHGFIMPKDQNEWQDLGEGMGVKLPDDVDPYDAISQNFRTIASHWLYMINELEKEE